MNDQDDLGQISARGRATHEADLLVAVTDVVAHREEAAAALRSGSAVVDDLADLATDDPAALYWAAYTATHTTIIYGQPTAASEAITALQDMVTEPVWTDANRTARDRAAKGDR